MTLGIKKVYMKSETLSIQRYFDIIIFVATTDEKEAILNNTKLIDSYIWETEHDKNGEVLHTLLFETANHKVLRIALQTLPTMGGGILCPLCFPLS